MTQEKNGVSALELSRELGTSYNATWRLKHKLMQAMKERDDEAPLSGIIQLDLSSLQILERNLIVKNSEDWSTDITYQQV